MHSAHGSILRQKCDLSHLLPAIVLSLDLNPKWALSKTSRLLPFVRISLQCISLVPRPGYHYGSIRITYNFFFTTQNGNWEYDASSHTFILGSQSGSIGITYKNLFSRLRFIGNMIPATMSLYQDPNVALSESRKNLFSQLRYIGNTVLATPSLQTNRHSMYFVVKYSPVIFTSPEHVFPNAYFSLSRHGRTGQFYIFISIPTSSKTEPLIVHGRQSSVRITWTINVHGLWTVVK